MQKRLARHIQLFLKCLYMLLAMGYLAEAHAWKCAYVSSYHKGYAWSDGIERGLRDTLDGKCELVQFDMDTKRHRDEPYIKNKAQEIAAEIGRIKPDILITSDDNAARYLVVPYFDGGSLPVVFCGINWTVSEYGFPSSNVTGMVEVAPVRPLLTWAGKLSNEGKRGLYVGADTFTEKKNYKQVVKVADDMDMIVDAKLVDTLQDWQQAIEKAGDYDFILLGSSSGINDWSEEQAAQHVMKNAARPILTNHGWMMPFSMLGFAKIPEEQGEWAAQEALAILNGIPVDRLPVVANRKWQLYENTTLLRKAGIDLPANLRSRAKKYIQGM